MNNNKLIRNSIHIAIAGTSLICLSSMEIANWVLIPISSLLIGIAISLIKNV